MFSIHTHDHQTITSILFFPAVNNHRSSHVVLLASPNACVAECYYDCDPSVHFYTKLGYHVLVYDYRGSGGSTGDVTPENTVSDARLAVEFVEKKYKISLEIVHGTSIGGYVVPRVSSETPLLIFDRTFCDMHSLVSEFVRIFGNRASKIASIIAVLVKMCRRWPMKIAPIFDIHRNSLILFDPEDEIVSFPASLITGLTSRYCRPDSDVNEIETLFLAGIQKGREIVSRMATVNDIESELSNYEAMTEWQVIEMEGVSQRTKVVSSTEIVFLLARYSLLQDFYLWNSNKVLVFCFAGAATPGRFIHHSVFDGFIAVSRSFPDLAASRDYVSLPRD